MPASGAATTLVASALLFLACGSAGNPKCDSAFAEWGAAGLTDQAAGEATLSACATFEEWSAGRRAQHLAAGTHPEAASQIVKEEIVIFCEEMAEGRATPVCDDASSRGLF